MRYDHPECEGPVQGSANFHKSKSRRKNQANKSAATSEKPATETLYEIDLFCEICNHDYKSLMSLNRHMKTRKHLAQVAKLNEAKNEPELNMKWAECDRLINACDPYQSNMYTFNRNEPFFDSYPTYDCYDNALDFSHSESQPLATSGAKEYDCSICYETFRSAGVLHDHSQDMQIHCSNLIDDMNENFDLDDFISDIDQP